MRYPEENASIQTPGTPHTDVSGGMATPLGGQISVIPTPGNTLPEADSPAPSRINRLINCVKSMADKEISHGAAFLFIPVFLASGASIWFALEKSPPVLLVGTAFVATFIFMLPLRHHRNVSSWTLKAMALVLAGMLLADFETSRLGTIILDTPVTTRVTGKVERRERDGRGYWRYVIELHRTERPTIARQPQRIALLARGKHEEIPAGSYITGLARLSPPSGPALPDLNDFAMGSYFAGNGATGFFYGSPQKVAPENIPPVAPESWLSLADSFLYSLRSGIAERIRSIVPGDAGAFSASIITDERRAISADVVEALRVSGLAHIVAISGLNMALAGGIFFVGLRILLSAAPSLSQALPTKKIAAFAALLMVTAYYLVSGFAVSAERAWLMMSIMLIAVLVDRASISMRNVALSGIIIIVMTPSEVTGPSFRMSFAATLALVAIYGVWTGQNSADRFEMQRRPLWITVLLLLRAFVVGVTVTSLTGGLSTAIYSAEHFHRLSGFGLFANLAAMPVMSFIVMPAALVGMLLMPFGLDAPFISIMGFGLDIVISIAFHVASWGGDSVVGRQHTWFVATATAGFLLLVLLRTKLRYISLAPLLVATGMSFHEFRRPAADLLVDQEGQLAAIPLAATVATNRPRPPSFIYNQWKSALLLPENHTGPAMVKTLPAAPREDKSRNAAKPPDQALVRASGAAIMQELEKKPGRFACEKSTWCGMRMPQGPLVMTVENSAWAGAACDLADIVIVSKRVNFDRCRSGALLLDSETLRKTGAMEIRISGDQGERKIAIRAANAGKQRPWTVHRYYDWRKRDYDYTLPAPVQDIIDAS